MSKILRFFSKELQKAKSVKISAALDPFNATESSVATLYYLNYPFLLTASSYNSDTF